MSIKGGTISQSLMVLPMDNTNYNGGKMVLPDTILHRINSTGLVLTSTPMVFRVSTFHKITGDVLTFYFGILEFNTNPMEKEYVKLPQWIIQRGQLDVGDQVIIENCNLPKVKYLMLKNLVNNLYDIPNYQIVLQNYFTQSFIALQINDQLSLEFEGVLYEFTVSKLMDENNIEMDNGLLHEVDLEVDIEDYFQKPILQNTSDNTSDITSDITSDNTTDNALIGAVNQPNNPNNPNNPNKINKAKNPLSKKFITFGGSGQTLNGLKYNNNNQKENKLRYSESLDSDSDSESESESESDTESSKFIPFGGRGFSLMN